jgi:hypothetical protein
LAPSFSCSSCPPQALKEDQLQQTLAAKDNILASTIATTSSSYTAAPRTQKQTESEPAISTVVSNTTPTPPTSDKDVSVPDFYDQSKVVTPDSGAGGDDENKKKVIQNQNPEQFNLLASALFSSTSNPTEEEEDPFASPKGTDANAEATTNATKTEEGEVLRLPNRAVTVTKTKKDKGGVTFGETTQHEVYRGPTGGAGAATGEPKTTSEEEGEEEEDEETLLPRMTEAEKVAWRAKQEDLTRRRKGHFSSFLHLPPLRSLFLCFTSPSVNHFLLPLPVTCPLCFALILLLVSTLDFHGACAYAFKGVFSWQMYSAVDAVDEFGKAYTVCPSTPSPPLSDR